MYLNEYWIAQYEAMVKEKEKWRIEAFKQHPTQEAYDAACAALQKHRERADAAQARIRELESKLELHQRPDIVTRQQYDRAPETMFRELGDAHG